MQSERLGGAEYVTSLQRLSTQHEQGVLNEANVLVDRASQKKPDARDCEELAKHIHKMASSWRRATSLSAELFTEISIERANHTAEMSNMAERLDLNERLLNRAEKENESIRRLIAELNSLR